VSHYSGRNCGGQVVAAWSLRRHQRLVSSSAGLLSWNPLYPAIIRREPTKLDAQWAKYSKRNKATETGIAYIRACLTGSGIVAHFRAGTDTLVDGNYLFLINGGVLGIDATRSGTVGGTQATSFHRLFGDSDGDRDVDGQDFGRYRLATMATPARPSIYSSVFDYDNDGGLLNDLDDYYALFARLGSHL